MMDVRGAPDLGEVVGAWEGVALFDAWRMSGLGAVLRLTTVLIS